VVERQAKKQPQPLTRDELEACYFALIDLLTSSFPIDDARRTKLKALASRLSEHARHLEAGPRTGSGLRKKIEPRDMIRERLLGLRPSEEVGTWAIYAEEVSDDARRMLLAILPGTYAQAVEQALTEPGFITEGMGGVIDLLGITSEPPPPPV
jgi:hypothetical protein